MMTIDFIFARCIWKGQPLAHNDNGGVDVMVRTSAIYREQLARLINEGKPQADADFYAFDIALTVMASRERRARLDEPSEPKGAA